VLRTLLTILAPLLLKCSLVTPKDSASPAPNAVPRIVDTTTVEIPNAGGTVRLDAVRVNVGADTVNTNFKIKIFRTNKSLFEGGVDDISFGKSCYIVNFLAANGSALNPDDLQKPVTLTIEHKIYGLPDNIMALVIGNFSEDPASWLRQFKPYEDLLIESALPLPQATVGDIVTVQFQVAATNLAVQIV
jgi:hypothetical protein